MVIVIELFLTFVKMVFNLRIEMSMPFLQHFRIENVVVVTHPTSPIPVPDDDEPVITNVIVSYIPLCW